MGQRGFWDEQQRVSMLQDKKPVLHRLTSSIPWESFRPMLEKGYSQERKSNAGRKRIDPLVLFKMLVLQQLFNLSDDELEFQVNDRRSFEEFVGLGVMNSIPDATTVAFFRERLRKAGVIEELFEMFETYLRSQGLQARGGQIIDATLVPVPKQRNSREENKEIKAGNIPEGWEENPNRLQQKDLDARWVKKNGVNHFGYKNSICIDVDHGFIRRYAITTASIHDSQMFPSVLDPENEHDYVWADSAYAIQGFEELLSLGGYESLIHEEGSRNHPLQEASKELNRLNSAIKDCVDHVFGCMTMSMGGKLTRKIGLERTKAWWGLKNLTFNFLRYLHCFRPAALLA
ncbi:IS5 family transposase [Cyanobium sp. HWJ4-Hawea]|uniref:IS5 family transposase n=1 Tax=Cyanobium sp. HWJ4-Hawea TaxID=2823713 RepID=UPI0020CF2496|nr:IS5 family transposase [Cyanobium sp. HWJ4-Hawea]MCP9808675.1 IS5 family transposase [Cyanobium sp. HWJ4-Hawea]